MNSLFSKAKYLREVRQNIPVLLFAFACIAQIFQFADERDAFLDRQVNYVVQIVLELVELSGFHRTDLFRHFMEIFLLKILKTDLQRHAFVDKLCRIHIRDALDLLQVFIDEPDTL